MCYEADIVYSTRSAQLHRAVTIKEAKQLAQIRILHPSASNSLLTLMVMCRSADRVVLGSVELQKYCPASDGLIAVVKFPTTTAAKSSPATKHIWKYSVFIHSLHKHRYMCCNRPYVYKYIRIDL